ncbi:MAG: HEPN domain-containing protein [Lachnospiraceae bacterium]|nr:HEPN domain-containing protein [Lachnospiraceae bacterium]
MYNNYLRNALVSIVTARQALQSYESTKIRNFKSVAAYHTQQSVEYVLKYLIYNQTEYHKGKPEPDIPQLYSHDLDYIITKYCEKYKISVPAKIRDHAEMISRWEAESRYKLSFSARINSILSILNEAEEWLCNIKPAYKKTIRSKKLKYRI